VFLATEETMIGSSEVGVGEVNMGESMLKLVVESLAFLIIPLVHRARVDFSGGGGGPSEVRV